MSRERLGSRLGFLLLSAGCAIGLGNVWRFPWIVGQYGGAIFVLIYLFFLLAVATPALVMEFAVGRASRRNMGRAYHVLEPEGTHWHRVGWISLAGSYLLMMFYIPVAGWMLAYCFYAVSGRLEGLSSADVASLFGSLTGDPAQMAFWALLIVAAGFGVCWFGVRGGVERAAKLMMGSLLVLMLGLALRSVTLSGGEAGLSFYLAPDWSHVEARGLLPVVCAAMNQAFFTISVGIGSMMVFGSYLNNDRSLTGESLVIVGLDTFVAIVAGLSAFPACFAFGVQPDSGPGLIFVTLPNVFNSMENGRFWASLFFIFMACAALTTVIAVLENIICHGMDAWGWKRRPSIFFHGCLLALLVMPCILGFNLWSDFQPFGPGSCVLDLEDFLISNNALPGGCLVLILFCTSRRGWGWKNFVAEAEKGRGPKFPLWTRAYLSWALPLVVLFLLIQGYVQRFL